MNLTAKERDDRSPTFQMTAMVDMVFILLAFFVLASEFRRPERDFSMDYGPAGTPARGPAAEDLPSHIPVRLQASGSGVAISIGQARLRDNDFDGIRAKLTEINMPEIGVRILAEESLSVGQLAEALDAVLASPMRKVSYSAVNVGPVGGGGDEPAR
jgi:biopolymer transport protein ExbD